MAAGGCPARIGLEVGRAGLGGELIGEFDHDAMVAMNDQSDVDPLSVPHATRPPSAADASRATADGASRRPCRWSVERVGVALAVVVFLCVGLSVARQVPAFHSRDERAHVGYAYAVADGHLPEIADRPNIPDDASRWRQVVERSDDPRLRGIWVANHPPLFYVLVTPLVWISDATHRADGGLLYLRLANLVFASIGIVFTYLLTVQATRGSRRLGLAAAAMVAVLPRAHFDLSLGLNDGLAFAAATGVVWAGLRALGHGYSLAGLAILGATAAVGAGTRAASMLVAVAVVGVVALVRLVRRDAPLLTRARASIVTALVGLSPAAVLFGWFYVRNIRLYGDLGGSMYLMDHFGRERQAGLLATLSSGDLWVLLYQGLSNWSIFSRRAAPPGTTVAALTALLAIAGLILIIVGGLARWRPSRSPWRRISPHALLVCLVVMMVVAVTIAQHVGAGGLTFPRYTLPALGVLACLFVVGLDAVLPRVLPLVTIGILALWTAHFLPTRIASEITRRGGPRPDELGILGPILTAVSLTGTVGLIGAAIWASVREPDPRRQIRSAQNDPSSPNDAATASWARTCPTSVPDDGCADDPRNAGHRLPAEP